jgi:cysteine desulfurase family protein
MGKLIYFDNAATSWPKPDKVIKAIIDYQNKFAANPGRSGHRMSLESARMIFETRMKITKFFNGDEPLNLIFTQNVTHSLNIVVKGLLKQGDHIITTSMEHNAVMRPINELLKIKKIEMSSIKCTTEGKVDINEVKKSIKTNTRIIFMTAASNVTGTVMPLEEVGKIAKEKGIIFCVDAAQAAGVIPIDVKKMNIDLLAFTGHKSLFGPTGIGGLYIKKGLEVNIEPLLTGGTGSRSEFEIHPDFMPDRFEAGTPNVLGIAGLNAGIDFVNSIGLDEICKHEHKLLKYFIDEVNKNDRINIYGSKNLENRIGVVSFNILDKPPSEISEILDEKFSIMSRPGLHCAPSAHKTIKTFPQGTVRFSFNFFNTIEEVEIAVNALSILSNYS